MEKLKRAEENEGEVDNDEVAVSNQRESLMRAEQEQKLAQRSHSQGIAVTSGEDEDASDSSQIISLRDQVVMYNGSSQDTNTALIKKLERELTDAQLCNLRLNAKIGALVSGGSTAIKKELIDLKVSADV
ncbi:hypothetical protein KIN20_037445 [Parelaphostrongylus tenuis]|uniref:Uncharacterized protein n=1 Tax=Parelaphostrongylus tenuis TaxID=148309 RepID=A0AAD5RDY3_PARTN|nr:hypothetical protein KIN20_037445 [Parelaphostrongylus tenuis]